MQFPLRPLLRIRELRADRALREVAECKAKLADCIAERNAVQRRLDAISAEEASVAAQMMGGALGAAPPVLELTRCMDRLQLLRDRRHAVIPELQKADVKVDQARQTLAASVRAYRQARAKCSSATEQEHIWNVRQLRLDDYRDTDTTDDHVASQFARREQLQ